jgi:cellulose synthase operon protein C
MARERKASSARAPARLALAASVALSCLAPAANVVAEPSVIHPDVLEASAAITSGKGPEAYTALRNLWRAWDRADPTHVEEALVAAAENKALAAPVRVYADLLVAYARRRRGDLEGAFARVDRLGFTTRFMTVGPFDNDNKTGFAQEFQPEQELAEAIPAGRAYEGKERAVRWRVPPTTSSYGWFDFGEILRPRESVCGYATTFVRAKPGTKAPRKATLWVGSSGAFKLFHNGTKVLEDKAYRDLDINRFATTVTLRPTFDRITIKVCGDDDAPKFSIRIGDEAGKPDLDVEMRADLEASADAARAMAERAKTKGAKDAETGGAGGPKGPVQVFEELISAKTPSAASLEQYARYLAVTGGDPRADHKARDLARRAAEAEPTVARLLLAGELAEDRNQRRAWVERASGLAKTQDEKLDVLLSEAHLARTGANWRDAVPIYERILALDPDNLGGTLGLVELSIEAGLKRTALGMLEKAVQRSPRCVSLLSALASHLRALGREADAEEIEARYAALRFDDADFLSQRLDLAVARRDAKGAERWLDRFLSVEAGSAWARGVAARTYRSLGQKDRALATYQQALALAPEDVQTLRALSDLYGEEGDRDKQLELLRQILTIVPQAKEVREYVEHIAPKAPRSDEAYAWAPDRFLPMRKAPLQGYPMRYLRNLTVTTVYQNGLASRFRQVVFQPLTDESAAAARQYSFAYEADRQTVELRAAKVYRQNGKVDEATESGEGPANNPAISMYTSQRTFGVLFPRLNAGDVVELRYRVEDVAPRNEISDYFGEVEYLQDDKPIASSEYVLITPKSRKFFLRTDKLPGITKDVKEDGDKRIYRLSGVDVPPLAPEPNMPPWPEVLGYVHVSTFDTWDSVGAWYWGLAREQFDVDDEVRKRARELTKGLADDAAKVRAIYRFATETRYVALEFGIEGIRPRRAAQTLARGWGDCKDKATLIVTMLREVGISSTIVLLRTRMRGDIASDPASLAPFDHAIVYVPSMDLYLDGTAEHTGSTELPVMDRGAIGLLVNEGKPKLVRLPQAPPEQSVTRRHVDVTLAADGSAQLAADVQVTGAHAPDWRRRYLAEGTRRERASQDLASDFGPIELGAGKAGVEAIGLEDVELPVKIRAKGKATSFARREGDALSVPASVSPRLVSDLAPSSKRTLDVVIGALTSREEEWVLKLPAGAKIRTMPAAQKLDTPFGAFNVSFEQAPGKVTVRTSLVFRKARVAPNEYDAFRSFCEAVDRAFGQRIVVDK